MESLAVGDRVIVNYPGCWTHGLQGRVLALDATSSDGIRGVHIQFDGGRSVLDPAFLTRVS